jgi:hypothetical protein
MPYEQQRFPGGSYHDPKPTPGDIDNGLMMVNDD